MSGNGMHQQQVTIDTASRGRGLYDVTDTIRPIVAQSGIQTGVCSVFIRHTSCSFVIQENADPTARADLEAWLERLAPEHDPHYTHTLEGPDDMPAHLKSAILGSSVSIPIGGGKLNLGTWQGIYLCEHRDHGGNRRIVLTVNSD